MVNPFKRIEDWLFIHLLRRAKYSWNRDANSGEVAFKVKMHDAFHVYYAPMEWTKL